LQSTVGCAERSEAHHSQFDAPPNVGTSYRAAVLLFAAYKLSEKYIL